MIGGLLTTASLDEMGQKYKGEIEAVIIWTGMCVRTCRKRKSNRGLPLFPQSSLIHSAVWSPWQFADTLTDTVPVNANAYCVCSSFVSCSVSVFDSSKRSIYPLVLKAPSGFTVGGTYHERIRSERRTFTVTLLFLWIFMFLETDGNIEYSETKW